MRFKIRSPRLVLPVLAAGVLAPAVARAASDPHGVDMLPILSGLVLMLLGARLGGALFLRFGQSAVLGELTVGILGMAFKGGSDDPRESLAYKLRKILLLKAKETLCSDEYVADPRFLPAAEVIERADLLVIGAPHPAYRTLATAKPVVDIWDITGQGVLV